MELDKQKTDGIYIDGKHTKQILISRINTFELKRLQSKFS